MTISFKANCSINSQYYRGNTKKGFTKVLDDKTPHTDKRKQNVSTLINYFESEQGKMRLERIPKYDEIYIDVPTDYTMGKCTDPNGIQLQYFECEQKGRHAGDLKEPGREIVPKEHRQLNFSEDRPFNIHAVKSWLHRLASYHKQ